MAKISGEGIEVPAIKVRDIPTRNLVQSIRTEVTAVATGNSIIPLDDTKPLNSEGTQFGSITVTPRAIGSTLEIEAGVSASLVAAGWCIAALHNGGSEAVQVDSRAGISAGGMVRIDLSHSQETTSLAPITFTLRVGSNGSNTVTIGGTSGVRLFGGTPFLTMKVKEYLP